MFISVYYICQAEPAAKSLPTLLASEPSVEQRSVPAKVSADGGSGMPDINSLWMAVDAMPLNDMDVRHWVIERQSVCLQFTHVLASL